MPRGNKDIYKHATPFKKGKSGNPKGRPIKPTYTEFIEEALAADGKLKFKPEQVTQDSEGNYIIAFPTDQMIAYKLVTKALSDPRYLDMLHKLRGSYKPLKQDVEIKSRPVITGIRVIAVDKPPENVVQ